MKWHSLPTAHTKCGNATTITGVLFRSDGAIGVTCYCVYCNENYAVVTNAAASIKRCVLLDEPDETLPQCKGVH